MKIGFDAKRAFQNSRGLGNYSRNLITGLLDFMPENEYYLFGLNPIEGDCFNWSKNISKQAHIVEPKYKSKLYQPLWRSKLIYNDIINHNLDIYHGLSHEIPIKLNTSTKYIVTVHDLLFLRFKESFKWIDRQIYLSKIKRSCKSADLIIAVSEQTKHDLINFLDVPESKIVLNYQSCSSLFYYKIDDEIKQKLKAKYSLPNEFLLFVGALVPHKNIERIIEAHALVPENIRIPLVIIGKENNYKKTLLEKIKEHSKIDQVIFINYVDTADLPAIYQLAKILVWPSLFEGFGIPIIEALFSKLPVITSNVGCFPEVGGDGTIYVDPNNSEEISKAIVRVLSDDTLYLKMQTLGKEFVMKFHIKNTSNELMKIYSSL